MQADNKSKPLLLSTQVQVATYWPQIEKLLLTAPISEEFTPDAVLQAVLAGQMLVFAFIKETEDGEEVELAMVLSKTPSETLPVMTIITVAGKNLKQHINEFWEFFKGWCVMNGARAIDAYVPERMVQLLEPLGLKRETVHVRLRL